MDGQEWNDDDEAKANDEWSGQRTRTVAEDISEANGPNGERRVTRALLEPS